MKAYYVDDERYEVGVVEVDDGFTFEEQYELWRTEKDATAELKKRVVADMEYLQSILEDLN